MKPAIELAVKKYQDAQRKRKACADMVDKYHAELKALETEEDAAHREMMAAICDEK